jgi:ribose/xylose/arabinose/galactoside ABC-type transport system permease subunit
MPMDTAPIATAPITMQPREAWGAQLRHRLPMETWVAGRTVLLWVGLALASPYFLTAGNVFNIMRQVSTDAIIAYGELFAIILDPRQ